MHLFTMNIISYSDSNQKKGIKRCKKNRNHIVFNNKNKLWQTKLGGRVEVFVNIFLFCFINFIIDKYIWFLSPDGNFIPLYWCIW
jgi:hypothetical protein